MRNALIGAFVLSAILAPYAAYGDLAVNADGSCTVLDETATEKFIAAGLANTTVKVKTNGTTLGTCRTDLDLDPPLLDGLEFKIGVDEFDCRITGILATEWQESLNKQGKLVLQCKAEAADGGLPSCGTNPNNPNCIP